MDYEKHGVGYALLFLLWLAWNCLVLGLVLWSHPTQAYPWVIGAAAALGLPSLIGVIVFLVDD